MRPWCNKSNWPLHVICCIIYRIYVMLRMGLTMGTRSIYILYRFVASCVVIERGLQEWSRWLKTDCRQISSQCNGEKKKEVDLLWKDLSAYRQTMRTFRKYNLIYLKICIIFNILTCTIWIKIKTDVGMNLNINENIKHVTFE